MKALVTVAAVALAITVTVVIIRANSAPTRSVAAFCGVYHQQERQFMATYESRSYQNDPLAGLLNSINAMSDLLPMFEKLDAVAPPSIEPDVSNVVDSLKQEEQAAGHEFSDPLGALGDSLVIALMSSASWNQVDKYISQHCYPAHAS